MDYAKEYEGHITKPNKYMVANHKAAKVRNFIIWAYCPGHGFLPTTRVAASRVDLECYFPVVPCEHGHLGPVRVSDDRCITCYPEVDKRASRYYKIWQGRAAKEREREATSTS